MPTKQEFLNCCYVNEFNMKEVRKYFGMKDKDYAFFKEHYNLPKRINAMSILTDEQFTELYLDTENDYEMGAILGVASETISAARRKRNLDIMRANGRKRKPGKKVGAC